MLRGESYFNFTKAPQATVLRLLILDSTLLLRQALTLFRTCCMGAAGLNIRPRFSARLRFTTITSTHVAQSLAPMQASYIPTVLRDGRSTITLIWRPAHNCR